MSYHLRWRRPKFVKIMISDITIAGLFSFLLAQYYFWSISIGHTNFFFISSVASFSFFIVYYLSHTIANGNINTMTWMNALNNCCVNKQFMTVENKRLNLFKHARVQVKEKNMKIISRQRKCKVFHQNGSCCHYEGSRAQCWQVKFNKNKK